MNQPLGPEYTVFSKSGCPNCKKVKDLLKTNNITPLIIDCDEALLEDRDGLLQYLREIGATGTTFPFVFHANTYVGGYADTVKYHHARAFADKEKEHAFSGLDEL